MYNGFECSQKKSNCWHTSPSEAAWAIVVLSLFRSVSSVSEEVMTHFDANPFANGFALAQQVITEMVSVAGSDYAPIIWRAQHTNQTRYVTALEVCLTPSQLLCTYSLFSSPRSVDGGISEPLLRLTHRDTFSQILKGHSIECDLPIVVVWNQKISQLLLQQFQSADLEGLSFPSTPILNVLYILRTQIQTYHESFNGDTKLEFEKLDAAADHIFSKIYTTEKTQTEFQKRYRTHCQSVLPCQSHFLMHIAGACRSPNTKYASHFVSSIMPTEELPKLIWGVQVTECQRLIGLVKKHGLRIVDEPRGTEVEKYPGGFATFPLYIADRFGIWCPDFSQLLLEVYAVYEESAIQFQNQNEAANSEKTKTLTDLQEFLLCFSFHRVSVKEYFLQRPQARKVKKRS